MIKNICVAGAGTMGSGIALAAAQYDYIVTLFDTNESVVHNAQKSILKNLDALIEKNKITPEQQSAIISNLTFTTNIANCTADLVIEAIIEKEEAKNLIQELSNLRK